MQIALNMLETERNYRVAKTVQETSDARHAARSAENSYCESLTPYVHNVVDA